MSSYIELTNIEKSFGVTRVLRGVNLSLDAKEHCVIKGASGSGKSTLLYLLGGLDVPDSGAILVNNKNLAKMKDDALAKYRNSEVGFVFQFHFLLPSMHCLDNILLPAQIGNHNLIEVKKHIMSLSEYLGVAHCLKKFPYEISGGEQQRINVIRALSLKPSLLLCDEPTGNLDKINSKKVIELIKDLALKMQSTLIVVTHDEGIASGFERKITIEDGEIIS